MQTAATTTPDSSALVRGLQFLGRWVAVVPAALVCGILGYFVSAIGNSIGGLMVSGIVTLFACAIAGYAAVSAAKLIAPNVKVGAGLAVASMVFLGAFYSCANGLTGQFTGEQPIWYTILLLVAMVIGALSGIAVDGGTEVAFPSAPPAPARWVLFLPLAIVAALPALGLAIITELQFPRLFGIMDVEVRFLTGIAIISVATAVAPAGKRVVASLLGGLWGLVGGIMFFGAIARPLITAWVARSGNVMHYYLPAWQQAAEGLAWLLAAAIPICITYATKAKVSNAKTI
jgi:hypothetical protein